jgi:cell division transport system permease protein
MTAKKKKLFGRKYQYDIALEEGIGAHLVTWVTGLMVFFVTLALAVNLGLNTLTHSWVSGLSGSLTVEIQPPMAPDGGKPQAEQQKVYEESIRQVLLLAKQHPAVASGRALTHEEILNIIRPWLGDKISGEVPLPALIDLKLAKGADVAKLQSDIRTVAPAATVDTHDDTLDDVRTLVTTARLFVLLLTGVIVLLAVAAVAGIVRAKLAIHAQEVETLHLIGASDEYIARQFRQHTLKGSMKGALLGLCCLALTLLGASYMTHTVDAAILPHIRLMPLEWAGIMTAPLVFAALVAHLTAQKTALRELARLP